MRVVLFWLILIAFSGAALGASLEQVLADMDRAAAAFKDMSAKLTRLDHTAVINDTSRETGTVRMKRVGAREIRLRIDFEEPDPRTVVFERATARIYYPKIQTVQVYDLGKHRSLIDQFLMLGFGSSGTELAKNYQLKVLGEEKISGEATVRLELVPKAQSVKEYLSKAELWVASNGCPMQQKFSRPSGDYTVITYEGLSLNTNLADQTFRLALPKGVKVEYPQK